MPLGDTETWPHYISHFLAGNYIPGCVVSRKHEFARGTCCDVIKIYTDQFLSYLDDIQYLRLCVDVLILQIQAKFQK